MHRIDESGHQNNKFARENGNQIATRFGADWPNAVQEEICNVIEATGAALNKGSHTQLLTAIQALISGSLLLEGKWLYTQNFDANKYKLADGATYNRADFPDAWAAIQTSGLLAADATDKNNNPGKFGRGNGTTTFEMPDLRDQFLRVYKGNKAGAIGPSLGGFKANQNQAHTHTIPQGNRIGATQDSSPWTSGDDTATNTYPNPPSSGSSGGDEAVPDHTSLIFVIRMK